MREKNVTKNTLLCTTAIILVMGNKGGVGKSAFALCLIESLRNNSIDVAIFDADGGNPDIAKHFLTEETRLIYDLNVDAGFLNLLNAIGSVDATRSIVISTPAGIVERSQHYGRAFIETLPELNKILGREVRVAWVIDNKRDVLESLADFREMCPGVPIDVVRNLYFGASESFGLFNTSKQMQTLIENGGRVLDFPALATRVMQRLSTERVSHAQMLQTSQLGDRVEYQRWFRAAELQLRTAGYVP